MKISIVLILLSTLSLFVSGQKTANQPVAFDFRNSFQIELGGHGLIYSLNYERIFFNSPRFKTSIQLGVSYYPPKTGIIDLWIPILVNELVSFGKHHIEIGAGNVFIRESTRYPDGSVSHWEWNSFFTGRLGYRLQVPDGKFVMRAAFTPLLSLENDAEFHPLVGLSFGYAF